jgi:hypothetical protein
LKYEYQTAICWQQGGIMKNMLFLLLLVGLTAGTFKNPIHVAMLNKADASYDQLDLTGSRAVLNVLVKNDSVDIETKCDALRRLALQDWKYYKNYDVAKNQLMTADSIGFSKSETWALLSRIERESVNYQNSLSAAENSEKYAKSESEKTTARNCYAQTAYDYSITNLNNNIPLDKELLATTSKLLIEVLESDIGSPTPSKLLLGISLLRNDGANVIYAWKSYFHISDINNPNPYLASAAKELQDVCSTWNGNLLTPDKQEKLILALSHSRFYVYAGDFALTCHNQTNYDQTVSDFLIYSRYLKVIKTHTNEYYRQVAIGKGNAKKYEKWLNKTRKDLWNDLSFIASSNQRFNETNFLNETEKYFGAKGYAGATSSDNTYSLCLGHIVNQEKAIIEQYGYKPEFTFTDIDMMTCYDNYGWFCEDQATGGWATEDEFIRIREVYLYGPVEAWKVITDTVERQKIESKIADFVSQSNTDNIPEQARGLEIKLKFDALNDLYDKLASQGLIGKELKLAFLSTYENYRLEASIMAHEGRHSIEKKYFAEDYQKWPIEEIEFHAKLSQIVFAPEPRFELGDMVNDLGESGHGLANKKIVDIAINWIKNNHEKMNRYSPDKSAFSQIYLMTNEQIKECYQSEDPLFAAYQQKK